MSKLKNNDITPNVRPTPKEKKLEEFARSKKENIKMGIHSIRQMLGDSKQKKLFDDKIPDTWLQKTGSEITNDIIDFGINLNDTQMKVLEGLLRAFSKTNYKGDDTLNKSALESRFKNDVPIAYRNIDEIPIIRIGQRELLRESGIKENNVATYKRGIEALSHLGTTQFCFYWTRLAYDKSGKPIKNTNGSYKMEEVTAIDTLFKVKEVKDEESKILKYYEVEPSVIFLDQLQSYFLMIPADWRNDVTKILGKRKASSYLFKFIYFLRLKFEEIRRHNVNNKDNREYIIIYNWDDVAKSIKMPDSVINRNKKRANNILEDVYTSAQKLGYLDGFIRDNGRDTLSINFESDLYFQVR